MNKAGASGKAGALIARRPVLQGLAAAAVGGLTAGRAGAQGGGPGLLTPGDFEGTPSFVMSNGALDLTVLKTGASLASVVLRDDADRLNPLWNSVALNRLRGRPAVPNTTTGHLVCVDGFGTPSPEEAKAGLLQHGEAHLRPYEIRSSKTGPVTEAVMTTTLPIVQERFTRTLRMVDGENVVYVESKLDSLLGFDRTFTWVEHATVGPPFVEAGVTVFDLSAGRARTNPYQDAAGAPPRRMASDRDFTWPMAPGAKGGMVDTRQIPEPQAESEFTSVLLDPTRDFVWTTSLNPRRKLIIGYVMRRADYPWMLNWGSYATPGQPVRGMEFGVTLSGRRRSVETGTLFGAPTYRWLPANGSVSTHFLMFYARAPDGMRKVDDVRLENGEILIEDRAARRQVRLKASLKL